MQLFIWIGVFLDMYARTEDTLATGIILYGSYISESVKLSDYPVPVLTISGDQDGLCRLTRVAKDFGWVTKGYGKINLSIVTMKWQFPSKCLWHTQPVCGAHHKQHWMKAIGLNWSWLIFPNSSLVGYSLLHWKGQRACILWSNIFFTSPKSYPCLHHMHMNRWPHLSRVVGGVICSYSEGRQPLGLTHTYRIVPRIVAK